MTLTAALADFSFGLRFASRRYRSFAQSKDTTNASEVLLSLARERLNDARQVDEAAASADLGNGNPTLNDETAGIVFGLGGGEPLSAVSAAYRVQRAENTLGRMAAQLSSLVEPERLRAALNRVRNHINNRRDDVRQIRQSARLSERLLFRDSAPAQDKSAEGQHVVVWFGTNRRRAGRDRFLGERADSVSYGRCKVFIPKSRAMGSLGSGLFKRLIWGDDRVKISGVEVLRSRQFWSAIKGEVADLDAVDKQGLLFLHGYRTKFSDAARRTAQLKVDLAHTGPAAFFSWPSLGELAGYTGDEAAIEGSEQAVQDFLVETLPSDLA